MDCCKLIIYFSENPFTSYYLFNQIIYYNLKHSSFKSYTKKILPEFHIEVQG